LTSLVRHHGRLFDSTPVFTVQHKPIVTTRHVWCELTCRFAFGHPPLSIELDVIRKTQEFQRMLGDWTLSDGPPSCEALVTANVVLEKPIEETYSVWYGSDYSSHASGTRSFICQGPWAIDHISDLRQFNYAPREAAIVELFDTALLEESGVNVLSIINLVVIVRSLIPNRTGRVTRYVRRRI
jgi:hypothetical protein